MVKHNRLVNQLVIVHLVCNSINIASIQLADERDALPHLVGQYIIEHRVLLLYQVTKGDRNLVLDKQRHKGFENGLKQQLPHGFSLYKSLITYLHPYLQYLVFH